MSAFVATAPTSPAQPGAELMGNDGWFPDIDLASVRDIVRIDGTVTAARLRAAVLSAISHVNDQLAAFKATHLAADRNALADVPAPAIDGDSRLVLLYNRAVHCTAKADLIERYRDFDSTDSGQRRADDMDPAIGEQRRNAFWAIRDLLGQPRTVVELI